MTCAVPAFAFIPVDGGKVDELIEEVFLILVDIKNVRLIWTGEIVVGLNHAMQKVMATDLLAKVFFAFVVKELKFQVIKFGYMMFN